MSASRHHSTRLAEASAYLLEGRRQSSQTSYSRRAPASTALPHLIQARNLLSHIVEDDPGNPDALELLSHTDECLLDYESAVRHLELAVTAGLPRTPKLLKRLSNLRESLVFWQDIQLSPEDLDSLGDHLETLNLDLAEPSLEHTRAWLTRRVGDSSDVIIAAFSRHGGFTDWEVLANIVRG